MISLKRYIIVLLFFPCLFYNLNIIAQNKLEIIVYTPDQKLLPAANIIIYGLSTYTGITDTSGQCGFKLPEGSYLINVRYLGFKDYSDSIRISGDLRIEIYLKEQIIEGKEVIIEGKQPDKNIRSTEIGITTLQQKEISALPKMIGETDVLKALQYTPGVTLTGEGNSGIYIRGGATDQNLILLDNAVIFNPAHLLGIFSIFNTDIIQEVKLYKSGVPSNYGGRISSVLDIETTKGNFNKIEGQGSVSLIASKLFITGPIIKEKLNFFVSVRKSYIKSLLFPLSNLIIKETNLIFNGLGYDYYDLNSGFNYRLSKKDFLQVRFYTGQDLLNLNQEDLLLKNRVYWSNLAASFEWSHIFNTITSIITNISHSRYNFAFLTEQDQSSYNFVSEISVTNLKMYLSKYYLKHKLKIGIESNIMYTLPNSSKAKVEQFDLKYDFRNRYYSNDFAFFFNENIEATERWKFNIGYRHSLYRLVGPYKIVNYDVAGNKADSLVISSGGKVVGYHYPEFRLASRYLINTSLSVKAAFSTGVQYLNQLTISTVSLPSDFWIPSTPKIKPQYAKQISLGLFKNLRKNKYETSVEVFYKTMENLIEFNNSIFNTRQINNFEDNLTFGEGESYGFELSAKKVSGKLTGWISYTLSRSFRFFSEINNGLRFPAKYDRIHDGSVVISYKVNGRWTFSSVFVYATGEAYTLPLSRYMIQGNVLNEYSNYNSYRLPDYHRLDVSATLLLKQKEHTKSELNFSVYNVYNRQNPLYIYNEIRGNLDAYDLRVTPKQLSLLPILPSIS